MRKNLLITAGILLLGMLFFPGCQKAIEDPTVKDKSEDAAASENTANRNNKENSCRLVYQDWSAGGYGITEIHYNEKGLADQWDVDFGYGIVKEKMYYDKNNRIVMADEDYFGSKYSYRLYYSGKHLSRITRTGIDFPDDVQDFKLTYNHKGQVIRQDDDNLDTHVLMYYDDMGNCTRTDIYFGSDLWYSDIYTFDKPIKNPFLNVPGVDLAFLYYGGTFVTNKRHFSSNRTVIYDAGVPFVFNDYDPSKTVAITGSHNLPSSVNYYDRISETSLDILFEYENCDGKSGGNHNGYSHGNKSSIATNRTTQHQIPLLTRGSAKSMKEQIQKLREQYRHGNK